MTFQSRELYRSGPNGDRWSLVREPASGRVFIEHEPNISSGGQTSRMEIGDFLTTLVTLAAAIGIQRLFAVQRAKVVVRLPADTSGER